jgi:hypothetical protein
VPLPLARLASVIAASPLLFLIVLAVPVDTLKKSGSAIR